MIERQKMALTTTTELQRLRANNHELTTFAEFLTTAKCNDREVTSQKLNNRRLRCVRFVSLYGCCRFEHAFSRENPQIPDNPTPLVKGVEVHPAWQVGSVQNPLFYSVFLTPTP